MLLTTRKIKLKSHNPSVSLLSPSWCGVMIVQLDKEKDSYKQKSYWVIMS